jgi:urease accessory protein
MVTLYASVSNIYGMTLSPSDNNNRTPPYLMEDKIDTESKPSPTAEALPSLLGKRACSSCNYTLLTIVDAKTHFLLLLSDSALPLGSFALSSGLESYIAHRPPATTTPRASVDRFLRLSLLSIAHTTLPFVIAAHKAPSQASCLDDEFDASTICTVARRASVQQGRALLTVYERSFSSSIPTSAPYRADIDNYRRSLRSPSEEDRSSGHFGVSWGILCRVCGLDMESTCHLFLLNHVKAILSAAVRQSLIGPYHMHTILSAEATRESIGAAMEMGNKLSPDMAGQVVPTIDLYQGRHELLYSRVFNS